MPHPESERGLRVQLATAIREANALHTRALNAEERAKRESDMRWEMEKERGEVNAALKNEMARAEKAESERDDLRAEVKRLREALTQIVSDCDCASHECERCGASDPIADFDLCSIARAALAAPAAGEEETR